MSVIDSKQVVTRKAHRCWGCRRKFLAGSSLHRVKSVDRGEWLIFYWCAVCCEVLAQGEYHCDDTFNSGDLIDNDPQWKTICEQVERTAEVSERIETETGKGKPC